MTIDQFKKAEEVIRQLNYLKEQRAKIESISNRNYDMIQFNAVLTIDSQFISFEGIKNASLKKVDRMIIEAEKELQEI